MLAVKLLERRGYEVTVAGTGREALAAWEKEPYHVILMDLQMPDMDGFAATAAIRAGERQSGAHIPIIALTAHTMKGDRERCLEAGMDAFVSKPLNARELYVLLEAVAARSTEKASEAEASEIAPELDEALAQIGGDEALFGKMAEAFSSQAVNLLEEIRSAITERDGPSLQRAAHKLKGSVGSFRAYGAMQAARRLEEMGCQNHFENGVAACCELERQVGILERALTDFCMEGVA
jgi:CheY-like chemotaxis protein